MEQEKINRINELAKKAKEVGLTEEEKAEQKELRQMFLSNFTSNLKDQLDRVYIQMPDGSVEKLEKKDETKE